MNPITLPHLSKSQNKPKIGILYIATGRYHIFWEACYKSIERYFLNDCEKHYFIFTDYTENLYGEEHPLIHRIYQEKLGWPYDTLKRFEIFLKQEDKLKEMDYLFFFNANLEVVRPISLEDLGLHTNRPLTVAKHPGFYNLTNEAFTYDRNPDSQAYIPQGEGTYYVMGGFNGGRSTDYLKLCHSLRTRIDQDEASGIIALWHDESQLNKYVYEHPELFNVIEHSYGYPEEFLISSFLKSCFIDYLQLAQSSVAKPKIIIRNKAHIRFGGHKYLRGQVASVPFKIILKQAFYKCCKTFIHPLTRTILN